MNAATSSAARKRPVNLTLNEALVQEARALSGNLSATVEAMLQEYVARERGARAQKQRQAAVACPGLERRAGRARFLRRRAFATLTHGAVRCPCLPRAGSATMWPSWCWCTALFDAYRRRVVVPLVRRDALRGRHVHHWLAPEPGVSCGKASTWCCIRWTWCPWTSPRWAPRWVRWPNKARPSRCARRTADARLGLDCQRPCSPTSSNACC